MFHSCHVIHECCASINTVLVGLLKIETGRHHKPCKIAADERCCIFCNDNIIEIEIHFILACKHYNNERQLFLKTLNKIYVNKEMSLQEKFI